MYNVLIVDDEPIERKGLRSVLENNGFVFNFYEAGNGKAALEILKNNVIDLMLTDIVMPHMDGITLIEKMRDSDIDTQVIIVSAYDHFTYAQRALSFDVGGYLLKPVDETEIVRTVSFVIGKINENQELDDDDSAERHKLLASIRFPSRWICVDIIGTFDLNRDEVYALYFTYGVEDINFSTAKLTAVLKKVFGSNIFILHVEMGECIIFGEEDTFDERKIEEAKYAVEQNGCTEIYFSLSGKINGNCCLNLIYEELRNTAKEAAFRGKIFSKVREEVDNSTSEGEFFSIAYELESQLKMGKFDKLHEIVESFCLKIGCNVKNSSSYSKYLAMEILSCFKKNGVLGQHDFNDFLEDIFKVKNLEELRGVLLSACDAVYKSNGSKEVKNKDIIAKIKEIVAEEYSNPELSLQSIAQRVYFHTAYLSTFFKNETGKNLIKYITSYRMEKAREMFENTDLKVQTVAKKTGYIDVPYFCTLYKKYFGITPSQYRKMVMK